MFSEGVLGYLPEEMAEFHWRYGLDADSCPDHLETEEWERFRRLQRYAELLLEFAKKLQSPDPEAVADEVGRLKDESHQVWRPSSGSDGEDVAHYEVSDDGEWTEVGPTYEITAWEFIEELLNFRLSARELERATAMTGRVSTLLRLLMEAEGETTQVYLARVAQCYLLGLTTEGLVMCRSVLEAACERVTDTEQVARHRNTTREPSLCDRLKYLRHDKRSLEPDSYYKAMDIKDRGNRAAHGEPHNASLEETLQDLKAVLDKLADLSAE